MAPDRRQVVSDQLSGFATHSLVRIGLHALGIGSGADPAVITSVARAAEDHGFATLWAGEHVVMVDRRGSRYPYSADGRIGVPSDADWLDPLALFGFLAAATSRIRLATGILLLPEHNPVATAKTVASLDVLSRGRFTLGVGVGWSAEEFEALGVPFAGRARRTEDYVEAMRVLWRDEVASYAGTHVHFDRVRCYPKPLRHGVPVVFGGNSDRALRRAAEHGDGWYGFNVALDELPGRLGILRTACSAAGRAPESLDTIVALVGAEPSDLAHVEALGVTETVVVEAPPARADESAEWVTELARKWNVVPSSR
jgi:probable F420-dependent oxidoreductase